MNHPHPTSKPNCPLASTTVAVTITDLVAEYVVCHRFQNDAKSAIEAVFSFPVPLDAAFLGMRATLAGETVIAQIQPQRQASRTYDDAIAQGHSAVLLRAPEPGVLCTSLGNLLPGETGEIELRFVTALRVADRTARFSLPLVHRPRYGNWRLEELEKPTHDFAAAHPMSATIRVEGLLASAPVTCATHAARFARNGESLELSIGHAMLDRDLALTFELTQELAPVARLIDDGETALGMASFVLPERRDAPKPLDLCLVLDGSGSMTGDAIEQSRRATTAIIDVLGDGDRIQVLRFGSTVVPLFRRPLLATPRVRESLRALVPAIRSDLGGTEMGRALEHALDQLGPLETERSRAIILVTDGAVQPADIAEARAQAIAAGVRIFVVAVGSCAGTEVLGPLAEATGALVERAVPAEPIDAGVMRQFRRAREAGAVDVKVEWPGNDVTPISMGVVYPGDAVNLAAVLSLQCQGEIKITADVLDFSLRLPLGLRTVSVGLRALLGQQRYRLADAARHESMALRYSLLTAETSAVLVKERAAGEQADGLPVIVQVPQMVPDGMLVGSAGPITGQFAMTAAPAQAMHPTRGGNSVMFDIAPAGAMRHAKRSKRKDDDSKSFEVASRRVEKEPEIPGERAREIFSALLHLLRNSLAGSSPRIPNLAAAVQELPVVMRQQALQLVSQCGLALDEEVSCGLLLAAVVAALEEAPFSDEEEAVLAVSLANHGASGADPSDSAGIELIRRIKALMGQGAAPSLASRLLGAIGLGSHRQ